MKVLCVALILVVVGAQPYTGRRAKTGFCPPAPKVGTCDELCTSDYSCPGNQKCCSHGCGHSCQEPTDIDCSAVYCAPITCRYLVRPRASAARSVDTRPDRSDRGIDDRGRFPGAERYSCDVIVVEICE